MQSINHLLSIAFICAPSLLVAEHWPQKIMESIDVKEAAFCSVLDSYSVRIKEAVASKNAIRERRVYDKQAMDVKALMPTGEFNDWIMQVDSIEVDKAMNATLRATLPCHKMIVGMEIPPTNSLAYEQLADVGEGDFVLVSGQLSFERDSESGESSSDTDKELSPEEFGAKFTSIVGLN